jgi:hypothetical protein
MLPTSLSSKTSQDKMFDWPRKLSPLNDKLVIHSSSAKIKFIQSKSSKCLKYTNRILNLKHCLRILYKYPWNIVSKCFKLSNVLQFQFVYQNVIFTIFLVQGTRFIFNYFQIPRYSIGVENCWNLNQNWIRCNHLCIGATTRLKLCCCHGWYPITYPNLGH